MSNSISAGLAAHYASGTTTLAQGWKITRTDGAVYGFTNIDTSFVFNGVTYVASTGFTGTNIESKNDLSVDNLEVQAILDSASITEADLMAGLWDFASVEIFEVNYKDLTMSNRKIRKGKLGEVSIGRTQFNVELRGMTQQLQQTIGEVYSPSCQADLGDSRCGINLASYTVTGTVTSATSKSVFTDSSRAEAAEYFEGGKITWTSGLNNGLSMEVKTFSSGSFTLYLPMPYTVAVGDTYSVYPGCKKRYDEDCIGKFNNAISFRGYPHIPGLDKMMQVGGT
jgi:uncharacterized phage protein (TIGR02218 family)